MIDLHLHLDGSVRPTTVLELAKEQSIDLGTYNIDVIRRQMTAPTKCNDLNEYLQRFELPLKVLQVKSAIERVTYELVTDLALQGIIYAEIRFAPQLSCQKNMTIEEVTQSAIKGMNKALAEHTDIKTGLILCCMRNQDNHKENIETTKVAKKYLEQGVVALDLAGAEALYETKLFQYAFQKNSDVPYTIHAGEAAGAESIEEAINLGATRIGHGVRLKENEALLKYIARNQTTLEMCPVSNIQTNAIKRIEEHPIREYLHKGLKVTVNTDNITVSNTSIKNEYKIIKKNLGIETNEIKQMLYNSIDGAFISGKDKEIIRKKVNKTDIEKWINF